MTPDQARIAALEVREAAMNGEVILSRRELATTARLKVQATAVAAERASITLHQLLFDNSDPERKSYFAMHWDKLKNGQTYARQVELLLGDDIHTPAENLTPQIMQAIFLRKLDAAPHGTTRAMSYLKPALNYFASQGHCGYNLTDLIRYHKIATVRRERVLSLDEWLAIWTATGTELDATTPAQMAIKTLMLTGARNREVAAMQVDELRLDDAEWHITGDRSKNDEAHVLTLPPRAVEIIRHAIANKTTFGIGGPHVFSNDGRSPVMLGSKIKNSIDHKSGVNGWVFHDIRRSFATHLAERGVPGEIVDLMLNHRASSSRGMVASIYNRSKLLHQRHAAAIKWGQITDAWIDGQTTNVVRLAGKQSG